jgi:hypothetical protein
MKRPRGLPKPKVGSRPAQHSKAGVGLRTSEEYEETCEHPVRRACPCVVSLIKLTGICDQAPG